MHLISDLLYFGLYEIEKLKILTLKKQSLMSEGHWGKNNDLSTSCLLCLAAIVGDRLH